MGKRFAILIGAAAAGVMALGAQTAAAAIVTYDTRLTINKDPDHFHPGRILYHGRVKSGFQPCEGGRRVVLFKKRPGADRKLGASRSSRKPIRGGFGAGAWEVPVPLSRLQPNDRLYAKVRPKVRDRFVCRADHSDIIRGSDITRALGAQTAAAGVVKYDTKLTVTKDRYVAYHGSVLSDRDRNPEYDPAKAVRKCERGRRVVLFKRRPGADRRLGTDRSNGRGAWGLVLDHRVDSRRVYGKVRPKVRDHFVCRADRSAYRF